ncbi:LAMI_0H16028g1_1 [Lachancea mirantina]|uniref:LAMI_0H16028g1_1 n=1 Tax=Lachancea mirantina TaxID=1230905 RepID=A0A1G4KIV2_9SACH|nr:LAMI_0H16028g1_1 [Lachancea mirantina]
MITVERAAKEFDKEGIQYAIFFKEPAGKNGKLGRPKILCSENIETRFGHPMYDNSNINMPTPSLSAHSGENGEICSQLPAHRETELCLANQEDVHKFLRDAFQALNQLSCKMIAKTWIKIIEPKKKIKYPYIKGNKTRPSWWPYDVEHREPDHLRKPQRVKLMTTIAAKLLPSLRRQSIFAELRASTDAISLVTNDSFKKLVLEHVYRVSWALSLHLTSVNVINLEYALSVRGSAEGTKLGDSNSMGLFKMSENLHTKAVVPAYGEHAVRELLIERFVDSSLAYMKIEDESQGRDQSALFLDFFEKEREILPLQV